MKYFIFFICVANLIVGLSCLVMYFTDVGYYGYNSIYLMNSSAGFVFFLFTAFYLWKNNFFKRNK